MKAIFYASSTGNTEEVAGKIQANLEDFELIDIADDGIDKMEECDSIIMGVSTWGEGELQDDWEDCFDQIQAMSFKDKKVALFGLGDQDGYPDEFVDGLGIMYDELSSKDTSIIGFTSSEGYEHDVSKAQIDDQFCGLVIDEDNQSELTDERISNWCSSIKGQI